jgi:hypothetical protein
MPTTDLPLNMPPTDSSALAPEPGEGLRAVRSVDHADR